MSAVGLSACCVAWLAACSPAVLTEAPDAAAPLPDRSVEGTARYEVVQEDTRVYARVFRTGRLEKLGHNHVVVFNDVRGYVSLGDDPGDSLFDLAVSSARVSVDPPELRRRQGAEFQTEISEQARERTRRNMLDEGILDASAYPYVMISSSSIEGSFDNPRVTMAVTIKGVTRPVTVPVSLDRDGDRLVAAGRFDLLQSDFGIEPFAALGGALKVKDRIEMVFTIGAEQTSEGN